MDNDLSRFGSTAVGLSKSPLGIIALFIVLVYGFASLVVGFSERLSVEERFPVIWFLVVFPGCVLGVFSWLVSKHHKKLYGPGDFKSEEIFLKMLNPSLGELSFAQPGVPEDVVSPATDTSVSTNVGRARDRQARYAKSRGCFVVHVLEPSNRAGQAYDIFIYLLRHKSQDYGDIEKAEFFFGHYWGNKIFPGNKVGNLIGVRTSAHGPFLCTCLVTFKDGESVMLSRYIDFEMGNYLKEAIKG